MTNHQYLDESIDHLQRWANMMDSDRLKHYGTKGIELVVHTLTLAVERMNADTVGEHRP